MSGIQFGDYQDLRTFYRSSSEHFAKEVINNGSVSEFYDVLIEAYKRNGKWDEITKANVQAEIVWWKESRPYFNVWPVMLDALLKFKVENIPIRGVSKPDVATFEIRFPRGGVKNVESVLVDTWEQDDETLFFFAIGTSYRSVSGGQLCHRAFARFPTGSESPAKTFISEFSNHKLSDLILPSIRCALSTVFMQGDPDAIEPHVLSKDLEKWDQSDSEEYKRKLEERAIKRRGRVGFQVGRKCDTSPHWRSPHLALFWTGKGRTKPKVKMRAGCVVKRNKMKEVPSGYRGE